MRFKDIKIKYKMLVFASVVLFFSAFSKVILNLLISSHSQYSVIVELAGKNRMLSQKIVSLTAISYSKDSKISEESKRQLQRTFKKFEKNIALLKNGGIYRQHKLDKSDANTFQYINKLETIFLLEKKLINEALYSEDTIKSQKAFVGLESIFLENRLLNAAEKLVSIYLNQGELEETSFKWVIFYIFLLNATIVFFILYLSRIYITQPINYLSKSFVNMFSGESKQNIKMDRKDEIGVMSENLDVLIDKLITAEKEANQAKQTQSIFLANMSHEIRTPMNSIVGFTNLLIKTPLNPKQYQFMNNIQTNAQNLLVIINDILDFSKGDANKIQLEQVIFSIDDTLNQVITACEEKAEKNSTKIIFNRDTNTPNWVIGDPTRLYQIALNLVSNAVKFTKNGEVTVTITCDSLENSSARIKFSVSDSGIGIAKEEIPKLFESFTQASSNTTRMFGGTGLGLSIVKQLVLLHGGLIEVNSELGKGSEFYFTISYPISDAPEKIEKPINEVSDEIMLELKKYQFNILLVEDIIFNRTVAIETMHDWGLNLNIIEAENGVEALKKLEENEVDIILMDIQMPEMDGFTATKRIREEMIGEKSLVPIIAMSAHASEKEIQLSRDAGMNDYLTKPFQPEDFLRKMVSFLEIASKNKDQMEFKQLSDNSVEFLFEEENDVDFQLVDVHFIREFTKGKIERIEKMVNLFLEQTPNEISKLKELYKKENYSDLGALIHSVKAKFTYMGVKQLSELAAEIEKYSKNGINLDQIEAMLEELDLCCQQVYKELDKLLITSKS